MNFKPFGIAHPSWIEPTCWYYDTAEEAAEAIRKVYGENSGHVVVGVVFPSEQHKLIGPEGNRYRWSCSCGGWTPQLGESVHGAFDRHLLDVREEGR